MGKQLNDKLMANRQLHSRKRVDGITYRTILKLQN